MSWFFFYDRTQTKHRVARVMGGDQCRHITERYDATVELQNVASHLTVSLLLLVEIECGNPLQSFQVFLSTGYKFLHPSTVLLLFLVSFIFKRCLSVSRFTLVCIPCLIPLKGCIFPLSLSLISHII